MDDGFCDHPKVDALIERDEVLGLQALGLWTLALTDCAKRLTDGNVSHRTLHRLATEHGDQLAQALVEAGLWVKVAGGHRVHDYLHYNPSKAEVTARRKARSDAGRAGATARWTSKPDGTSDSTCDGTPDGTPDGKRIADGHAPVPDPYPTRTRPDPGPVPAPPARADARNPNGQEQQDSLSQLAVQVTGVLQRGIDSLTTEEGCRPPSACVILAAMRQHPVDADTAFAVATDVRSIAQAQNRAPNIAALFTQKLAAASAIGVTR